MTKPLAIWYWLLPLCKKNLLQSLQFTSLSVSFAVASSMYTHSFFLSYNSAMPPFSLSLQTNERTKENKIKAKNWFQRLDVLFAVGIGPTKWFMITFSLALALSLYLSRQFPSFQIVSTRKLFINIERGRDAHTLGECSNARNKSNFIRTEKATTRKKANNHISSSLFISLWNQKRNEMKWNHQTAQAREAKQRKNREQGMHALTFTWAFSLRERVCVCVCVQLSPDRRKKNRTAKKKIQNKVTHTWKMNASTARLSWTIYTTCEYKYAENWLLYILNRTSYPIRLCGVMWCDGVWCNFVGAAATIRPCCVSSRLLFGLFLLFSVAAAQKNSAQLNLSLA